MEQNESCLTGDFYFLLSKLCYQKKFSTVVHLQFHLGWYNFDGVNIIVQHTLYHFTRLLCSVVSDAVLFLQSQLVSNSKPRDSHLVFTLITVIK